MLILLSVHVTSFLFLVWFNNFALTMGFLLELHALTLVTCSYAFLVPPYTGQYTVSYALTMGFYWSYTLLL